MIFDSHAHYNDEKFKNVDKTINHIIENNVTKVINISHDIESLKECFELTEKYDIFYMSSGIHPCHSYDLKNDYLDIVKDYALKEKNKAIGEIGLDYFYDDTDKEKQMKAFCEQLSLAEELNLPVIIHCRDAYEDTINILKKYNTIGVVHCFSGDKHILKQFLDIGYYISFTGVVTFKNAKQAQENLSFVPLDKLLIETDCPYMSPEPVRGSVNDSSNIKYIAKKYSEIKNISYEDILKITYDNACRLFKIS